MTLFSVFDTEIANVTSVVSTKDNIVNSILHLCVCVHVSSKHITANGCSGTMRTMGLL